jgi:FAD/FMN-containing dehydrogenase
VLVAQWLNPADDEADIAWAKQTFDALALHMTDAPYVNYLDTDDGSRLRNAYGPNWDRLVTLKKRFDPGNIFHLNQNIVSFPLGLKWSAHRSC